MDNMSSNKVQPVLQKAKKKQVKDELDRIKQAEKKKRRLEKALATSAAIRKELEKKKQIKKEQERLDEEGAAIAEAVALHVLCDDPDDSCKVVLNKKTGFNPLDCDDNVDFLNSERRVSLLHVVRPKCTLEGIGWLSNAFGSGCKWDEFGNSDWSFAYGPFEKNLCTPYLDDGGWGASEFSAGLIAAEAVSSLQIAEDAQVNTIVLNEMLKSDESWFKVLK